MTKALTKTEKRQAKQKELLVQQLKKSPIIEACCQNVGVARATFYRWLKKDPKFQADVDDAITVGRSLINDLAESKLIKAIKEENMTAIIFWLKHQNKHYKSRVELSGSITHQRKLTPQEEDTLKAALKHGGFIK